uniref:Uncharacterized protein n=1 Tax=Anguilla anguilla TaxID=7936 RepID=A0A0E9UU46_ANGAN
MYEIYWLHTAHSVYCKIRENKTIYCYMYTKMCRKFLRIRVFC